MALVITILFTEKDLPTIQATKSNVKKMYKADYVDLLAEFNGLIKHHENRIS